MMEKWTEMLRGRNDRDLTFADRPAAVDREHLSRDETRRVREQINRGTITILRAADPSTIERLLRVDEFQYPFVRRGTTRHRRFDERGREHIETNALRRVIGRGRFREADNRRLG